MESKNCIRCNGTGRASWGKMDCHFCDGQKQFPPVNITAIVSLIYNTGGRRAHGQFKVIFPAALRRLNKLLGNRAYYVWRMARFHGGVDVRMPITASLLCEGDPFVEELNGIADKVAKLEFGTDMGAVEAWRGKLF